MKIIITESQLKLLLQAAPGYEFKWNDFTSPQLDMMAFMGDKVFSLLKKNITNYSDTIELSSRDEETIKKEKENLKWSIDNRIININNRKIKEKIQDLGQLIFFDKIKKSETEYGKEYSLVNYLNNNKKFWISMINEYFAEIYYSEYCTEGNGCEKESINLNHLINSFFNNNNERNYKSYVATDDSEAYRQLSEVISDTEKLKAKKDVSVSKTHSIGLAAESEFENYLNTKGYKYRNFAYGGSFIDQLGVDFAVYDMNTDTWFPVQVKSNKDEALKTRVYNGITVYPKEGKFMIGTDDRTTKIF